MQLTTMLSKLEQLQAALLLKSNTEDVNTALKEVRLRSGTHAFDGRLFCMEIEHSSANPHECLESKSFSLSSENSWARALVTELIGPTVITRSCHSLLCELQLTNGASCDVQSRHIRASLRMHALLNLQICQMSEAQRLASPPPAPSLPSPSSSLTGRWLWKTGATLVRDSCHIPDLRVASFLSDTVISHHIIKIQEKTLYKTLKIQRMLSKQSKPHCMI